MKSFYLKFTKKTFIPIFFGMSLLLGSQGIMAATITSNAVTGNWSSTSAWVGGVVPTSTDDVVIVSGATITIDVNVTMNSSTTITVNTGGILKTTLTTNTSVFDTLTVNGTYTNAGTLTVSTLLGGTGTFDNSNTATSKLILSGATTTVTTLNVGNNTNTVEYNGGNQAIKSQNYRNLIVSGNGTKTFGITVATSVAGLTVNFGAPLYVYSVGVTGLSFTLGTYNSKVYDVLNTVNIPASITGTNTIANLSVQQGGTTVPGLTNYSTGNITTNTLGIGTGTQTSFTFANYGTVTAAGLSSTVVGVFTNYSTGVFNYAGATIPAAMTFTASDPGNTVNYSGTSQTVRIPTTGGYSNLILSNSGTKTIPTVASGTLCTGKMTIKDTAKASVTNANVGVNLLILGTSGQTAGTIGFTGSAATTTSSTYFTTSTTGYLNVQQTYSITSTAAGGDWNSASTWVDGVVPANSTADYVTIVGTATVNLTLTATFTVGALKINQGGILNVSGNFGFAIASRSPFSEIAGTLNLDATTGSKSFGNLTVAAGGVINSLGSSTSVGSSVTTPWLNNGTITMTTLGLTTAKTINNNGTFTCTGIGSTSQGIFNNNNNAIFNLNGSPYGTINNYGIVNSSNLSGTSVGAVSNFNNKGTGVLNFTGGEMTSLSLVLDATEVGNTVNYSATVTQIIKPVSYHNLTLAGSGSKNVALAKTLTIVSGGVLTVNNGVTLNNSGIIDNSGTITNNGDLILNSSATGTGTLLSSSAVTNVTQQRYLSSNQRGWRLISNPLSSTTFNVLATDSNIIFGTNFTGEYLSASNTWTSTNGAAVMDNNKAYKIFITGLAGESSGGYVTGPSNVTLVNKGTAANTAPADITTVAGKYYLVANPYTAPLSVASILAASTGLSTTISYYNPTNASTDIKVKFGGYDFPLVSGVAGSATDVVIPPMGAIFVQATIDGSISIPKTAIFTGTPAQTNTYNHRTTQTNLTSGNALKLEVSSGSVYYDTLALQFKAAGDSGSNIDFGKLPNTILEAYSLVGTQKMAVSELELIAQTIPLGITSTIQKNYTFKVTDNTITSGFEAVLVDNVLNTNTVLNSGTNYDFVIDSTPASQGNSRFAINLRTSSLLGANSNELETKIKVYPNPSRGHFNISNTLEAAATIEISSIDGQMIHSQKLNSGTTTIQTNSWATGVYILKATNKGTQITKKLVIQ